MEEVGAKAKRTPAKIKKRTPVKIKNKVPPAEETVIDSMFGNISPPQNRNQTAFGDFDISSLTPAQIEAIKSTSFAVWAATSDLQVDHRPFDFDRHKYLLPMYLDDSKEIVLMKAAQMGATIWMLLRLLWFCLYHRAKACLYFPTDEATSKLSKDRLKPLILSNPQLSKQITDVDTIGLKQIGKHSSLYLQHMGGEATKDSTPFDMICFDEVRLLSGADIDQARERISHSEFKYVMQVSTAGYPGTDISRAFEGGTRNYFHVSCHCTDGFIPSENWPDCMAVSKKEIYLQCPRCGVRITDPQNGRFISHSPGANYPSSHISQLLSLYISPAEIWDAWQRTQNIKEFYNAKLGKPFVDEENQPIKDDDLVACENPDLLWGPTKARHGGKIQRAMGVDQMGGNNYVVIAERHETKKRIVHFEIIDSNNIIYYVNGEKVTPFRRLYELMHEWDIDLCIIDAMPNINEATDFARHFRKRAFVAHYIEAQRDMVQWQDRPKDKVTTKRGGPKIKFKYTCLLSRYLSIDFALSEIANRCVEWSHPRKLVQICRSMKSGLFEPLHIFETHFYAHMKALVRQKTILDEDTGRFKMEWVNLGLDPHSCHAWNMCNIALERLIRQPIFTMV
jgi:hypothetical protein